MSPSSFLARLQTLFGVTKSEILIASIVLGGLLLGAIVKLAGLETDRHDPSAYASADEFARILDSIAIVEQSSFTGVAPDGEPIRELHNGDTTVPKKKKSQSAKSAKAPAEALDINTATYEQLQTLPGVGPATAKKIIAFREKTPFEIPEDIMRVKGIGKKKFAKMEPFIVVKSR